MTSLPLHSECPHLATPAERHRDPKYQVCGAKAGEPCLWARRWDGSPDPAFHSERLELASLAPENDVFDPEIVRDAALASGLV